MDRTSTTVGIDVSESPSSVFAYLADVRRHGEWSPKAYRIEGLDPQAVVQKGTRFTSYGWLPNDKNHRNEVEVSEFDPPHRLVLTATDRGEQFVNTFTVTPAAGGSHVERTLDLPRPTGVIGLLFPIILHRVIRPDLTKGLALMASKVRGR